MNDACCARRPPLESDYEPAGKHVTLDSGMKCYQVGSTTATRGIISIYDALGYSQPHYLGCDLLSNSLNALVVAPDFFRGDPISPSLFSLEGEERGKLLGEWFARSGDFGKGIANVHEVLAEMKKKYPSVKKWSAHGFCWGGKIAIMMSQKDSPFAVTAASHPGRIDNEEAKSITIPHIALLSGEDGTDEEAAEYGKSLHASGQDVVYDRFQDQVHGWMAARADFKDEKVKKEFERGYDMVSKFFEKHL